MVAPCLGTNNGHYILNSPGKNNSWMKVDVPVSVLENISRNSAMRF
jgi:hypothetical protein